MNTEIKYQIQRKFKNDIVKKTAEKFMQGSSNQDGAEYLLQQKIKDKDWTRQEFIEHAKKHGYLKTEKDAQIVEHVVRKNHLEDGKREEARRENLKVKHWAQKEINKYIEVIPERTVIRKIPKKFF